MFTTFDFAGRAGIANVQENIELVFYNAIDEKFYKMQPKLVDGRINHTWVETAPPNPRLNPDDGKYYSLAMVIVDGKINHTWVEVTSF